MGNQPSNGAAGGVPPGGAQQQPGVRPGQRPAQQMQDSRYGGAGGRGDQQMGYTPGYAAPQQQGQYGSGGQYGQQQGQYGQFDQQQGQMGDMSGMESGGEQQQPIDLATLSASDDDVVPTVFRWEHGGRQVFVTGTFNGWSRQIPMHRSGNDFTYIHNLKRGKHAFKFIVDDEWRFAPDQPTVADIEGRINNFIDVTDFKPYHGDRDFEREMTAAEYGVAANVSSHHTPHGQEAADGRSGDSVEGGAAGEAKTQEAGPPKDPDGETFNRTVPDLDEYTKEPPPLPPHLRHIILNKPPQLQDTAALPVPQHVALNHLYCTAIKDNMMVLGITQRYKTKFVTTVYYSPCT